MHDAFRPSLNSSGPIVLPCDGNVLCSTVRNPCRGVDAGGRGRVSAGETLICISASGPALYSSTLDYRYVIIKNVKI